MAKKKESIFKSWNEIDQNLKKLGELQIQKTKLEGDLTIKLNELKENYSKECAGISSSIKQIEKEINRFCEQNKDEFIQKRSKKLDYGSIAYRVSEKVHVPCANATIKALKSLNLDFCLRIKEEIDKDKLKELDSVTLTKIGASLIKEDKLTIEPNIIKMAAEKN